MDREPILSESVQFRLSKVKLLVQIDAQPSLGGFTKTVLDCRQVRMTVS